MIKAIFIIVIITFIFYIDGVTSLRSDTTKKLRLKRRSFAPPDPEKVVSTAETGLMAMLAGLSHTADNEYKLMVAKPAAVATPNTGPVAKTVAGFGDAADDDKGKGKSI